MWEDTTKLQFRDASCEKFMKFTFSYSNLCDPFEHSSEWNKIKSPKAYLPFTFTTDCFPIMLSFLYED
jgi:hypothetical protein